MGPGGDGGTPMLSPARSTEEHPGPLQAAALWRCPSTASGEGWILASCPGVVGGPFPLGVGFVTKFLVLQG